jgi:hypothetical protein
MMIADRIRQIEERLNAAAGLPSGTRDELIALLATLQREIESLPERHSEDAESIARFADASAHEATRSERSPERIEAALKGLTASVEDFEATHPDLTQTVNRIALILSNMGI